MKNLAVIGLGNWAKNLIREFSKISNVSICVSQGDSENIKWLKKNYPHIQHTTNFDSILTDSSIDTIAIITPINSHYDLALQSLKAGKNVFVEKPIATNLKKAKILVNFAKKQGLTLFIGYVFRYHKIFQKIKKIEQNEKIQFMRFIN